MADIKQHEYALLDEIARDSLVTQARLSNNLGIAVGSVNWYIKRLIHRGWVKVSRLNRTRLKYDLTPEGMAVFTQRTMYYARDSLKVYSSLRKKAKSVVADLKQHEIKVVFIDGDDEIMDIMRLTCIENSIAITNTPNRAILKSKGQDYEIILL